MRWIPLDGKKEPPFEKKMIILLGGTNSWAEVNLKEIKTTFSKKEYIFYHAQDIEQEYTTASHYMIPEPPKNNQ